MYSCLRYPSLQQQIAQHIPSNVSTWHCDDLAQTWVFSLSYVEVSLIEQGSELHSHIVDSQNILSRKTIDPLRVEVRQIISDSAHHNSCSVFGTLVLFLQILEHVADFEDRYTASFRQTKARTLKWRAEELNDWNSIVNNPYGLDPSTVTDTAHGFLGKTPEEICNLIPSEWRVIHIESVIRPDLAHRFLRHRSKVFDRCDEESVVSLRKKLPPHSITLQGRVRASIPRSDVLDDMLRPRMTFHGTSLANVRSIVRHGFKVPGALVADGSGGDRVIVSPRSGIAWPNRGIYSSQQPSYALSYASGQRQKTPIGDIPSMRLFVCATLMGRTYAPTSYGAASVHDERQDAYDAHFDGGFEYIIHDEAAILPCYVIHLDLGSQEARKAIAEAQESPELFVARRSPSSRNSQHHRLQGEFLSPGDIKREAERKKAAALKWFPYGFGSATGTQFKILEVGETSDDEEEYGEWQADKHSYVARRDGDEEYGDALDDEQSWYTEYDDDGNEVRKLKGSQNFLDQYQSARRAGVKGRWSDLDQMRVKQIERASRTADEYIADDLA